MGVRLATAKKIVVIKTSIGSVSGTWGFPTCYQGTIGIKNAAYNMVAKQDNYPLQSK